MSDKQQASQSEVIGFILNEYREAIRLSTEQVAKYSTLTKEQVEDAEEMKAVKNLDQLTVLLGFYGFTLGEYFGVVDAFIEHLVLMGVDVTPEALGDLLQKAIDAGLESGAYMKDVLANGYRPFLTNPSKDSTIISVVSSFLGLEIV